MFKMENTQSYTNKSNERGIKDKKMKKEKTQSILISKQIEINSLLLLIKLFKKAFFKKTLLFKVI